MSFSRGLRACFLALILVVAGGAEPASIDFNFDRVDVPTFARLVGEITGRRFVVSDDIKRKITIISPRVQRDEVYSLFVNILESAGCSVVQDGDVTRIVPLPRGDSLSAPVIGPDEDTPADGVITKIIRLEHVPASSLRKVLEARMGSKNGAISILEETNHLIVTDTAASVRRIGKMIAEVDRPGLQRVTEVVTLQYATAPELAEQLNQALAESDSRAERLRQRLPATSQSSLGPDRAYVVAAPGSNKLILIGTPSQLTFLQDLIVKMDIDSPPGSGRLNAIFLKYLSAEEAATNINALLDKAAASSGGKGVTRKIAIEASPANNALLVDASPGDLRVVQDLVNQLDLPRDQIHIEVLIAEITKTDAFNLGVEMAALNLPSGIGDTVVQGGSLFGEGSDNLMNSIQQGLFPNGISVGAAQGVGYDADGTLTVGYPGIINIKAVKGDSRFKLLSETALEAQNNTEASVSIVDDIPILESTIQGGSGASRDVIQNIERIDVGIKLVLTPHVIPGGLIRMELNPRIEAVLDSPSDSDEINLTPTIARREVTTTVTVPDGRTIIIAGLTRQDKLDSEQRVPFLGSIPLLGWLFRNTSEIYRTTDLLVFVTPTIVSDPETAARVMQEWQDKTGLPDEESD